MLHNYTNVQTFSHFYVQLTVSISILVRLSSPSFFSETGSGELSEHKQCTYAYTKKIKVHLQLIV